MNSPLPPRIEQLISERLACGTYRTAADVIEKAFEALIEREDHFALCEELQRADEQLANGEFTEYGENTIGELAERVKSRGLARLAEERRSDAG